MQSGISQQQQQKIVHKINCTLDLDKLSFLFPSCTLPSFSVAVYSINKQSNHNSYRDCHLWLSNSKKKINPSWPEWLTWIDSRPLDDPKALPPRRERSCARTTPHSSGRGFGHSTIVWRGQLAMSSFAARWSISIGRCDSDDLYHTVSPPPRTRPPLKSQLET